MSELVTAADREAARLRDRLAEIEVEQATLEAELAAFNADYMRVVMTVMLDVHELDARILTIVATRSEASDDAAAARTAHPDQVVRRLVAGEGEREQDRRDLLVAERLGLLVVDREQRARIVVGAVVDLARHESRR